ncbi:MAG: aldehyde dehydrogenase family protein [Wenzhouxiangellaceae bacterium]
MEVKQYPYYLANQAVYANQDLKVNDKYSGELRATVAMADRDTIDQAIGAAAAAAPAMAALRPYQRQELLQQCVAAFEQRFDELAQALCMEAGKPIGDAEGEVTRLIDTFRVAAEESVRFGGEVLNLEISARAKGYRGMTKRVPLGACSFISPFNFPLNLAAHKIAPALAVGCPFVLKPASMTPIGALLIGEVMSELDLPEGAFSILPCHRDGADLFTTDERLKLLSFTGSPDVGWALKAKAGKKKVVLELGGNAACIVDEDADIDDAVQRVIFGAFYQSGQSCISVQRLLIHEAIYADFVAKLVEQVKQLKMGDPRDRDTFIGPVISEGDAKRLQQWVEAAVSAGAKVLAGGSREGVMMQPTVVENPPRQCDIYAEEAFGPVLGVSSFSDFNTALDEVNDSRYGLQAGVFTRDLHRVNRAWDVLDVGGVVINDVPSFRVDNMPYGGVKDSGLGREGIRYAMEDMSEIRLLIIRDAD